jgi:histidinol dehydrogenase
VNRLTDLIVVAGTPAARRRLARLEARGAEVGASVERTVARIIQAVRRTGDRAVIDLTRRLDGVTLRPATLRVPFDDLAAAYRAQPAAVRSDLGLAARRIRDFHARQRERSWSFRDASGAQLGQLIRPLDRVGVYVPGGRAAYPSTVLMTAVPARVAGVSEVIAVSPAGAGGHPPIILAACHVAGVDALYRIGGAQAVAALAYGTATIPRVDKIVGPGNAFVATAKRLVYGIVDIDSIAGPSEVLIVADGSASPAVIAADMLAQAEHDPQAAAICVTPDRRLAAAVSAALDEQLRTLPRRALAARALARFGAIVLTASLAEAVALADRLAPEHLELLVRSPRRWVPRIRHAGAVFVGPHAPEAFGDYLAGPNHVLPTGGTARFASPLGVYDFIKRTSLIAAGPRTLARLGPVVARLARLEGLDAHALSVERRLAPARRRPGTGGTRRRARPVARLAPVIPRRAVGGSHR